MKAPQQQRNQILTNCTRLLLAGAASILLALFAGCSGPVKWLAIQVESDPPGASVSDVARDLGKTPTGPKVLTVQRKGGLLPISDNPLDPGNQLTISKDGFESAKFVIKPGEYKYSSREEALRNVRIIKATLKPIAAGQPAR
ncbi:MAG: hypothetical protein ABL888_22730 [Pirellulaceae bacterium]